jgi:hypothetical protein
MAWTSIASAIIFEAEILHSRLPFSKRGGYPQGVLARFGFDEAGAIRWRKSRACGEMRCVMRMRYAIAGLFFALLCSCTPVPETEFALASVTPTTARIDAGLAAVTVEPASRDRAVYPLPRSLTPLLPLWQAALQDAVTRQGIFRPDAARRVSIVVKVLEFSLSGNILSVFARYQLFDVPAGNPVFSADIMSNAGLSSLATGVTSLDDPAVATQNRTQVIRAIQDNITQFLDQLEVFARQPRGAAPPRP